MDKLEHFLKKNHHRIIYYFTNNDDVVSYVMVLSIYEGVPFIVDVKHGDIQFVDGGSFQKRFHVSDYNTSEFPPTIHDQPVEELLKDRPLLQEALKVLQHKPIDGNLVILGPNYLMDVNNDGTYKLHELVDFPDTIDQHGIFQKYDLEYFYNHKNTISQNVKTIYTRLQNNFLDNLDKIRSEWEIFSKDPSKHLSGIEILLSQYGERTKQCEELKNLVRNMYQTWKQLSNEYDMLEIQAEPISFDQNLQMNQKKQSLYKKLDKIKLIEKHATDLLIKLHIICTCLLFYMHLLTCELGIIHFRIDHTINIQDKLCKFISNSPSSIIGFVHN